MAHSARDYCHSFKGQDTVHENPAIYLIGIQQQIGYTRRKLDYDIPYTAGLSHTGRTYFRDRLVPDCPDFVDPKKYQIDVDGIAWIDIPWMIHERTEWGNMHIGGMQRLQYLEEEWDRTGDDSIYIPQELELEYQPAHQLALEAEKAFVTFWGVDWQQYNEWCDRWIARAADLSRVKWCPPCLDLTPYQDEEDMETLQAIADAGGPVSYMLLDRGVKGGKDGRPFYVGV